LCYPMFFCTCIMQLYAINNFRCWFMIERITWIYCTFNILI
jgi:hypothetical protein